MLLYCIFIIENMLSQCIYLFAIHMKTIIPCNSNQFHALLHLTIAPRKHLLYFNYLILQKRCLRSNKMSIEMYNLQWFSFHYSRNIVCPINC